MWFIDNCMVVKRNYVLDTCHACACAGALSYEKHLGINNKGFIVTVIYNRQDNVGRDKKKLSHKSLSMWIN